MKRFKTNTKVRVREDALDQNGIGPVVIQYTYKGKAKKFKTGVSIKPSYLKTGPDQFVNSKDKEAELKNKAIKNLKDAIDNLVMDFFERTSQMPSPDYIEEVLTNGITKQSQPKSFIDYYEEFLKYKIETATGCKEYKNFKSDLKAFLEHPDKALKIFQIDFGFHSISKEFIEAFAIFLLYKKGNNKIKKEKLQIEAEADFNIMPISELNFGNIDNVVIRRIRVLIEFLRYATSSWKINIEIFYLEQSWKIIKKKLKITSYENTPHSITFTELEYLYNFSVEEENLRKAKDKFIFSCLSSLRVSDLDRISKYQVFNNTLSMNMKKTTKPVFIDLNETMTEILIRNDYNLKYVKYSQNYNEHLKVLFQKFFTHYKEKVNPEINLEIYERKKYGKVSTYEKKNLWDIMSSHKGRSSFVTINLERNTPLNHIMANTGHTSSKCLTKYNDTRARTKKTIPQEMELRRFEK